MSYFKINGIDFSMYVNSLKVSKAEKYNALENAGGNTVVDYINTKYVIEVGIIPIDKEKMIKLQEAINNFNVSITFLNPSSGTEKTINCIIPENSVEYYTIQANKTVFNGFNLQFIEL